MAAEEKFTLDRTMYKHIKSMNRKDMEETFTNVYKTGYEDALEGGSSATVNLDDLRSDLKLIKGVGENRLNEIMSVIEKHFNKTAD